MQRETIWTLHLICGISFAVMLSNCRRDSGLKVEWVYINETDSFITFSPPRVNINLIGKDTFVYIETTEAEKDVDIKNVGNPLNVDIVYFGSTKCDTLTGKTGKSLGPASIDNYEVEKRKANDFKCTFRFTQEMLLNAKQCK